MKAKGQNKNYVYASMSDLSKLKSRMDALEELITKPKKGIKDDKIKKTETNSGASVGSATPEGVK